MKTMNQVARASAALSAAAEDGRLDGVLVPAVFGCPYCRTAGIVTSPLPLGPCNRCTRPLAVLEAGQVRHTLRRAG